MQNYRDIQISKGQGVLRHDSLLQRGSDLLIVRRLIRITFTKISLYNNVFAVFIVAT